MMTVIEYTEYWEPAADKICPNQHSAIEDLSRLLDMHLVFVAFLNRPSHEDWPMSEELKELLIKLAGPHGKTILKMYRIQKGLE